MFVCNFRSCDLFVVIKNIKGAALELLSLVLKELLESWKEIY